MSSRSFQRSLEGDDKGWCPISPKIYPDKWILPKDSFVVTVNAAEFVRSYEYSAGISLRFPRITSIRHDKPTSDIQTLHSVHQMFFEKGSQNELKNTSENTAYDCRFLTPVQLKKKVGNRKLRKKIFASLADIPYDKVESESCALSGFSFAVLEGSYDGKLINCNKFHDTEYIKALQSITCRKDIIDFIHRHGGDYFISGSTQVNFIVGDRMSDIRVRNYVKANDRNEDNQMDYSVLRWTFILKMVFRWYDNVKAKEGSMNMNRSIKNCFLDLAQPERSDFLVLSSQKEMQLKVNENSKDVNSSIMASLLRAVKKKRKHTIKSDEQDPSLFFDESELWILSGKRRHLYSYRQKLDSFGNVLGGYRLEEMPSNIIVYVHFNCGGMDTVENNLLQSLIPLLTCMGATVTQKFEGKETHILISYLEGKHDKVKFEEFISCVHANKKFQVEKEKLMKITSKLSSSEINEILIVTPNWVNNLFDCNK